jgi:glycopeptide antibiotics resistance protein
MHRKVVAERRCWNILEFKGEGFLKYLVNRRTFLKFIFLVSSFITLIIYLCFSRLFLKLTSYLHPIVVVVVLVCIFVFVFLVALISQKKKIFLSIKLLDFSIALYSLALLILLFFRPSDQDYGAINLTPFSTIKHFLSGQVDFIIAFYNIAANIGLFVPYGLYLLIKSKNNKFRVQYQVFIPIIIISGIEILQFFTRRGSLDVDDFILNITGVYFGFLLAPLLNRTIQFIK